MVHFSTLNNFLSAVLCTAWRSFTTPESLPKSEHSCILLSAQEKKQTVASEIRCSVNYSLLFLRDITCCSDMAKTTFHKHHMSTETWNLYDFFFQMQVVQLCLCNLFFFKCASSENAAHHPLWVSLPSKSQSHPWSSQLVRLQPLHWGKTALQHRGVWVYGFHRSPLMMCHPQPPTDVQTADCSNRCNANCAVENAQPVWTDYPNHSKQLTVPRQ